ncbi:MAG TPA: NAD(P)-binding protein, partial [Candidatus Caenarcaniphilales bacterium]
MPKPVQITILGGGPAGLAAGYYAKKNTLPFVIFEASNLTGGHCVTLRNQDFYYDSGAHRFHDQDAEATAEIKHLLKNDLTKIRVPSQIFYQGKLIDFPLSPLNLTQNLGLYASARAALELIGSRCKGKAPEETFESFALFTYGKTIANQFLLNYSEKLWGVRCSQ